MASDPQKSARQGHYAASTQMRASEHIRPVLAANVKTLMKRRDWNQTKLAKKSGVSQRQVGYIVNAEVDTSIAIIEALARAFGVPGWLLMVPGLEPEVLDSSEIPGVVDRYAAYAAGRKT